MLAIVRRHRLLHIWALMVLVLFGVYRYGVSSREAANAVSGVTQFIKDGYGSFWYLFPFSVVEWFYVFFIIGIAAWFMIFLRCLFVRRPGRPGRFEAAYGNLLGIICLSLTAWGLYSVLWGVNYYADGFQEKSGIYARPVTAEELNRTAVWFAERLGEAAERVERDEDGVFAVSRDEIFQSSPEIYRNLSQDFPFLARRDRIPKKMLFSRLFSAMNFTGFYSPYTGESNLNIDSPACLLPANIAHELAHQRGIASEQECNFLAIAASTASDDAAYQYSGYLMGYIHLSSALHGADSARWEELNASLPDAVRADLRRHSAYWTQFDGPAASVSRNIYDMTLKSYGQSDGIRSYGTVVDLLVAYY